MLRSKRNFAFSCTVKACLLLSLIFITALVNSQYGKEPSNDLNSREDAEEEKVDGIDELFPDAVRLPNRRLLKLGVLPPVEINVTVGPNDENETADEETIICTPPAYHEFPPDAFTNQQRKSGAFVLHLLLLIYMFVALAIVCDIYFVVSLEKICEKLHLAEDVAGASFMAAGSSAPEVFTSIIGVFIAKGDVGVGTIVGSAVFNILFVIGICGILVTQVVTLNWYPLIRDSTYYLLSIIFLILSILDGGIQWYEAFIMLILYGAYIITMKFNVEIQKWAVARIHIFGQPEDTTILQPTTERKFYGGSGNYEMFTNEQNGLATTPVSGPVIPVDEYAMKSNRKLSFEDACFRFMKGRRFKPLTRFRTAAHIIICERRKLLNDPAFLKRLHMKTMSYAESTTSYAQAIQTGIPAKEAEEPDIVDEWKRIPAIEEGFWALFKWFTTAPLFIVLYYTVPDCRKERWDRWFMGTFIMSIVWIAIFSYIMVWMVVLIGFTLGIPDSIMGITFLAAGTSVPDAMASVMVARQGQGDMAVSNTLGSNVFDVLIGLALPWFIKTTMVSPGTTVHINSHGIVFSVILLFLTVLITLSSIHFGGWKLDRKVGYICLISYAVFLVFAVMIEFNVFGYVNPPMCIE